MNKPNASNIQDPYGTSGGRDNEFEVDISREIRAFRKEFDMKVANLEKVAGLFADTLSKI